MNKAVVFGINKYTHAPLKGCINDTLLMYKVLSEKFPFPAQNINYWSDLDVTRKMMIDGVNEAKKGLQPNDIFLVHYAGHGSQVVVNDMTETDEADGLDEILCPIDMDWQNPLRDKEFGSMLKDVPNGVKVVVILDCCHSGTGLRGNTTTNRYIAPPPSNLLQNPLISLDDDLNFLLPTPTKDDVRTTQHRFLVNTQDNLILLAACQDNQTAADAMINGRYHGAFTFNLVKTLAESDYKITYRKLMEGIHTNIASFQQKPQLECDERFLDTFFLS